MPQQQLNLFHYPLNELFELIECEFADYSYEHRKHIISILDANGEQIGTLRLPLHLVIDKHLNVLDEIANVLYLSVQSGNAAICLMEGTENCYHTTFSAYMTRKKQGFSQIKYLNKKGKSRAGSRVRLAKTVAFFENINTTMGELWQEYPISRLALDCSKTLMPYLFQSRVEFPVDKKDPVLYKIPLHIPQSKFTNLDAAIKKLKSPVLFFEPQHADKVLEIFS